MSAPRHFLSIFAFSPLYVGVKRFATGFRCLVKRARILSASLRGALDAPGCSVSGRSCGGEQAGQESPVLRAGLSYRGEGEAQKYREGTTHVAINRVKQKRQY